MPAPLITANGHGGFVPCSPYLHSTACVVHNIPSLDDKRSVMMSRTMTLNVRVSGALGEFVASNVSEYVRDPIRHDKQRTEAEGFERLKAELTVAFAAPESAYEALDAETVIARNARH